MSIKKGVLQHALKNTTQTQSTKPTLREAINANCRSCVFDPANAGNWRQQVTMCSCHDCAIYPVRPVSSSDIPEKILDEHGVPEWERSRFAGLGLRVDRRCQTRLRPCHARYSRADGLSCRAPRPHDILKGTPNAYRPV